MTVDRFDSVWDAIEDSPADAVGMRLRSTVLIALEAHVRAEGWTQAEAAARLGLDETRASDLLRGRIATFDLDTLVRLAQAAGLHVDVRIAKAA